MRLAQTTKKKMKVTVVPMPTPMKLKEKKTKRVAPEALGHKHPALKLRMQNPQLALRRAGLVGGVKVGGPPEFAIEF